MILITGAAGFIGFNFLKHITKFIDKSEIIVVEKFTYAANESDFLDYKVKHCAIDIANRVALNEVFKKYNITSVIHFAAESHVDNSIKDSTPFILSNIVGTVNLLDLSVKYNVEKFLHISTDEVFGEVNYPNKFNEHSNINPRNPYSASKASAEHFVMSYGNTHKLPYIIVNSSNNYGPYQHKEKLIPKTITNLINGVNVPVYGKGLQIRDWIFVEDSCDIIYKIFNKGNLFDRYCIGGETEIKNIDLVTMILEKMNLKSNMIEYVTDRLGHDSRYSTDITKIKNEFDWHPKYDLSTGLDITIDWVKNNENRI